MNLLKKNSTPVLSASHVFFSFDKTPLLQDISFTVQEGSWVAVIGPNGSGKTTLLKLLMGFLKPTQGSISLLGQLPHISHPYIGYVPQVNIYDQKFPLSVVDVVLMGALSELTWYGAYPKSIKQKADHVLHLVGLKHLKHRPFGTLSGGQAQRVLIARALIHDPKILFLDEPTANIDPETQKLILHLLASLKSSMTIIMVTHHLQSFIEHVDNVLCIQNTLTEFSPSQICEHFALGVFHSPLLHKKDRL
ncbi:MAG: ABC transporter ATP-binding protein [Chlamydiae bacterium]|nr:ABC transporter ATP-binding protein [Chlamydiota bacterium]